MEILEEVKVGLTLLNLTLSFVLGITLIFKVSKSVPRMSQLVLKVLT